MSKQVTKKVYDLLSKESKTDKLYKTYESPYTDVYSKANLKITTHYDCNNISKVSIDISNFDEEDINTLKAILRYNAKKHK